MSVKEKRVASIGNYLLVRNTEVVIVHQGFLNLGKLSPNNIYSYFPIAYFWLIVWAQQIFIPGGKNSFPEWNKQKLWPLRIDVSY